MKPLYQRIFSILCSGFFILVTSNSSLIMAQDSVIVPDILNANDLLEPLDKTEMEVISASRSTKKIQDLPVTIHVVTREEILQNGYITLVDVLKSLPGIRVSQPGSCETGETFGIRSFNGNQYTKILINNISVKPSVVIGMPIESQIPVRQAERIEVIYGPAAAVYGTDAIAGVVNIITKEASGGVFAEADVVLGQNAYDYINFHAGGKAGKNNNIFKYSFYGSQMNFAKMNIFSDDRVYKPLNYLDGKMQGIMVGETSYQPSQLTTDIMEQNDMDASVYLPHNYEGTIDKPVIMDLVSMSRMIGMEFKFKGLSLSYQYMYRRTPSSVGRSSYLYKYNDPGNYIGDKINVVQLVYQKDLRRFKSTTNMSFLDYRQDPYSNFGVTFIPYADKFYQYSMSEDFLLEEIVTWAGKNLEIVSGVSAQFSGVLPYTNYSLYPFQAREFDLFQTRTFSLDLYPNIEINQDSILGKFGFNPQAHFRFSAFSQAYYVYKKFTLLGGVRFDNFAVTIGKKMNENYRSINPRLSVLYKVNEKFSIRASYGRAFKEPSPNLKFNALAFRNGQNLDSIYYSVVPNPGLKPEVFTSYELGLRHHFSSGIFLDMTFFYNKISNLIIPTLVDPKELGLPLSNNPVGELARQNINSPEAKTLLLGSEFLLKWVNIVDAVKLNAEVGVTFSRSERYLSLENLSSIITMIPEYIGKAVLQMQPVKRTMFSMQCMWSSKREKMMQETSMIQQVEGKDVLNGFVIFDGTFSIKLSRNLNAFAKVINITNANYGGMEPSGYDIDLDYNPQYGRNIRLGLTMSLN